MTTNLTLSVPDISCEHCKHSIEGAVGAVSGVSSVAVDIDTRSVAVAFDDATTDAGAVTAAIEDQGYEVAGNL